MAEGRVRLHDVEVRRDVDAGARALVPGRPLRHEARVGAEATVGVAVEVVRARTASGAPLLVVE
jgi:hypothetical protein